MDECLKKVKRASDKAVAAQMAIEKEIVLARHEGLSLRAIASAAGVSYETVRRICES